MRRNTSPEELHKWAEEFLVNRIRRFGPDGGPTASARQHVAHRLEHLGRFTEARLLREEVFAACRRNLGNEEPGTLSAEEWLGWNLAMEELPQDARPLFQHVLEVRLRTLGPEHEDTKRVQRLLAKVEPLGESE